MTHHFQRGLSALLAASAWALPAHAHEWTVQSHVDHAAAGPVRPACVQNVSTADSHTEDGRVIALSPRFALRVLDEAPLPHAPRRLLLDRARSAIHLEAARRERPAAGSGQGVVVGIVDSGIDPLHPDLRAADGASRMAWWIDFGARPYGFYPELESDYGCDQAPLHCGILGPDEIAQLMAGVPLSAPLGGSVALPRDTLGHGTLVASLALGNGASAPEFAGVAPEATLVGARVATDGAAVDDLDVLLAARFVFERAQEMGLPAVLNLSLGGDMGPHDGTAAIERALNDWVNAPGRAIVVAAGNSGTLEQRDGPYPNPFGIHTDVHVPAGTTVRVPLVFPAVAANRAAVYAFIGTQPGDDLRVALEQSDGTPVLPFVARGETRSASNGVADATLVHHVPSDYGVSDTERGIALILSGSFQAGEVFSLLLEGDAVAELWLQSEGDLAPEAGRGHVVFPAATRERTVTIPASSPRLISVGATLNRTTWPSFGQRTELFTFDDELDFTEGTVMTFSSAGPNLRGRLKPDLVAPGGVIVGALSRDAPPLVDGRTNPASMFGLTPLCPEPGCAQVDDQHAVSVGTSMAAPLVTGAVALLLEHDPTLTQNQIRSLLMTGASRAGEGFRAGAGQLDIEQSFRALALDDTDSKPASPGHSWLSFAQSFAHPSDTESVFAWLHLRDAAGNVTTVASDALDVRVRHGKLTNAPVERAPGLVEFRLGVDSGQAGERLELSTLLDGQPLVRASLPIAVDSSAQQRGVSVRGGCAVAGRARRPTRSPLYLVYCVVCWVAARRRPKRAFQRTG